MVILEITLPHAQAHRGVHTHAHARTLAQGSRASQTHSSPGVRLTNWKVPRTALSRRHAGGTSALEEAAPGAPSRDPAPPRPAGSHRRGPAARARGGA